MTGFEPFGGHPENVSWEVARRVSCCSADGLELAVELLPVSFTRVAHSLHKAVERHAPDVVIMLGQSGGSDRIKLERVALNMMDELAANGGTIDVNEMMGSSIHLHVDCCGKEAIAIVDTMNMTGAEVAALSTGVQVTLGFGGNVCHVFNKETGINLEA